jgi:hypothetical protein
MLQSRIKPILLYLLMIKGKKIKENLLKSRRAMQHAKER